MSSDKLIFCKKCCMDGSAQEIVLDEQGVCNFCHQAQKALKEIELDKPNLDKWIEKIKKDGKGKKYDVIAGISGGLDSCTAIYYAVKMGLRVLAYSVDNGWQSDLAQENTMKIVEGLKVPYFRYTIDLKAFAGLQSAFLEAGLINAEIPSDHIIMATSLEMAKKYNCKWILSGGNVVGESIMPESWGYQAKDLTHIKSVAKAYQRRIKGVPTCGLLKWNMYKWVYGIKTFYLLDYLDYDVKKSKELLSKEFGWKDYGYKHEENTYTAWFQNFYLYEKFGIDKRKAHFASLINSGQMTRSEAMFLLTANPVYPALGIERKVMGYPKRRHEDFKTDKWFDRISKLVRFLRKWRY